MRTTSFVLLGYKQPFDEDLPISQATISLTHIIKLKEVKWHHKIRSAYMTVKASPEFLLLAKRLKELSARDAPLTSCDGSQSKLDCDLLSSITKSFVDAMRCKSPADWNKRETKIAVKAVQSEWGSLSLLSSISEHEFYDLATKPYPASEIRQKMVSDASQLTDQHLYTQLLIYFFHHDPCEGYRSSYLAELYRKGWEPAERYALDWWDSGETCKQMDALRMLDYNNSPKFDKCLKAALKSDDEFVIRIAKSISYMRTLQTE